MKRMLPAFGAVLLVPVLALAAEPIAELDDATLIAQFEAAITPGGDEHPVRCLFPHVLELQSRGLDVQAFTALGRREYQQYTTPDGRFRIEYTEVAPAGDADGDNVPDYVEWVAEAMVESHQRLVVELGYPFPEVGQAYLVRLEPLGTGNYGLTVPTEVFPHKSYIQINSNFQGFYQTRPDLANQDPDGNVRGAIRVTAAHELKHTLQIWSEWNLADPHRRWVEVDAVWVEEVVYDAVNDYYNYNSLANSPFTNPEESVFFYAFYQHGTWPMFLEQYSDVDFMFDFHVRRSTFRTELAQNAYLEVARGRGLDWGELWGAYAVANFLTGSRAADGVGFEEGAAYPLAPTRTIPALPFATTTSQQLKPWAADFHVFDNGERDVTGQLQIVFEPTVDHGDWGVSVVLQSDIETTVVSLAFSAEADSFALEGYDMRDYERISLVVGNGRTSSSMLPNDVYQFRMTFDPTIVPDATSFGRFKSRF